MLAMKFCMVGNEVLHEQLIIKCQRVLKKLYNLSGCTVLLTQVFDILFKLVNGLSNGIY